MVPCLFVCSVGLVLSFFWLLWCPGALVGWCSGFVSAMVPMLPWFSDSFGAMVFWWPGALVLFCPGVLGCSGALVFWCSGASCQSCPPAHSAVTRVSCCLHGQLYAGNRTDCASDSGIIIPESDIYSNDGSKYLPTIALDR